MLHIHYSTVLIILQGVATMARMPEKEARRSVVRFSDPRLHRVGFGIFLTVYNPKERTILLYRKSDEDGAPPGLSVIPCDETQHLELEQFGFLAGMIIREGILNQFLAEGRCLCIARFGNGDTCTLGAQFGLSIFEVVDQVNRVIEFLHGKLPWENVANLVWQNLS